MACNNAVFSSLTLRDVKVETPPHPSLSRLYDATAAFPEPVRKPGDLAARLGQLAATVTNWAKRGVSLDGAYLAQRRLGISAVWIIDGEGPMHVGGMPSQPVRIGADRMTKIIAKVDEAWTAARAIGSPQAKAEFTVAMVGDDSVDPDALSVPVLAAMIRSWEKVL